MKRRSKVVLVVLSGLIVASLVASSLLSSNVGQKDGREASASDAPSVSAELAQVLAKAGSDDLIKVWVELDSDEYEDEIGSSILLALRGFVSGMGKLSRAAYSELLPEEIVAIIWYDSIGVEPPVELLELHHYLTWYAEDLTPTMINSIANFPGVQRISLYKPAEDEPFLVAYAQKVAQEYPTYRIKLLIDVSDPIIRFGDSPERLFDPETGALIYDYESDNELIGQVLQKHGGEIAEVFTPLHSLYAQAPPSLRLITELSNLPEVKNIGPNYVYSSWEP